MSKKIAILRGINVGGRRKILMADLRILLTNIGLKNVSTYIQSGNVFFNFDDTLTDNEIESNIKKAILDKYGFDVPVIVRSAEEIQNVVKNNPFYQNDEVDITQLHLTFLKEKPTKENRQKAESYSFEPEKFIVEGKNVFIFCNGKYHKSKMTNNFFEKKLKVAATTRNWKTVLKLLELSK